MENSLIIFKTFVRVPDDKNSSTRKCFNMSFPPPNVLMSRVVGENCPEWGKTELSLVTGERRQACQFQPVVSFLYQSTSVSKIHLNKFTIYFMYWNLQSKSWQPCNLDPNQVKRRYKKMFRSKEGRKAWLQLLYNVQKCIDFCLTFFLDHRTFFFEAFSTIDYCNLLKFVPNSP